LSYFEKYSMGKNPSKFQWRKVPFGPNPNAEDSKSPRKIPFKEIPSHKRESPNVKGAVTL